MLSITRIGTQGPTLVLVDSPESALDCSIACHREVFGYTTTTRKSNANPIMLGTTSVIGRSHSWKTSNVSTDFRRPQPLHSRNPVLPQAHESTTRHAPTLTLSWNHHARSRTSASCKLAMSSSAHRCTVLLDGYQQKQGYRITLKPLQLQASSHGAGTGPWTGSRPLSGDPRGDCSSARFSENTRIAAVSMRIHNTASISHETAAAKIH